ncbi:hypothetical protein A7K94_0221055, partial [Modestobacter sp. VKM Ac-2676]
MLATVLTHFAAPGLLTAPALLAWSTVFVAICLQALPFLALGVLLSAAISTLVPASFFTRMLPRRRRWRCRWRGGRDGAARLRVRSVPVAGSLVGRGVPQAAARA